MSGIPEYANCDALGLAEMVRKKEVTPAELVEEAIRRIEERDLKLNAIVYKMYDLARAAAARGDLPDGPFRGVPFLLKDLASTYEGVPTSHGSRLLRDVPMTYDSEIVKRYKQAGVIVVGKTNAPEFGLTPYTEPEVHGPTHNPWDLSRTPGGSSGGSAAAVAARIVPMAGGSDGGGSLRIPASCCGVFAIKPTRARTPIGPDFTQAWRGLAIEGVLSRSVRDSAAMLDAVSGPEPTSPYHAPPQARPYLQEVTTDPGRLRIAFTAHSFLGKNVDEDCKKGLAATVELLQELGHEVVEDEPRINGEEFNLAFAALLGGEIRTDIELMASMANKKAAPEHFEPITYALGLLGKALTAADYANALRVLEREAREAVLFMDQYDVLLTPTVSTPPFPIGALRPSANERRLATLVGRLEAGWALSASGFVKSLAGQIFEWMPYTPLYNVSGQPAMSVPLYWNATLPIGMQFAGRFGDEATLFRLAGQLERARPWFDKAPPGFGN